MRRLLTPFILLVALVAVFAGCSSHPPLTGLTVDLVKLERAKDGTVIATVEVVNATVLGFNIASSNHQVFLNGRLVGTMHISEPLGLPQQSTAKQSAPLRLAGGDLTAGLASYRIESALTLLLYGDEKDIHKIVGSGTVQVP